VGSEQNLQIVVPDITKKSLKLRAIESGDSMRVIVLKALSSAGIRVPKSELRDRRKSK
jgi:hypothetical protein